MGGRDADLGRTAIASDRAADAHGSVQVELLERSAEQRQVLFVDDDRERIAARGVEIQEMHARRMAHAFDASDDRRHLSHHAVGILPTDLGLTAVGRTRHRRITAHGAQQCPGDGPLQATATASSHRADSVVAECSGG